jgi:hypothetical protein
MFHKPPSTLLSAALAVFIATPALAGVHLVPSSNVVPDPNNPSGWKTIPLSSGQTITIDWTVHTKNFKQHWAGVRFFTHVLDPSEVSLTGITMFPGYLGQNTNPGPFPVSTTVPAAWWHSAATQSGVSMPSSVIVTFGRWTIMAQGTSPANNSDVDLSARASSILHLGSGFITVFPSWWVWATSNFEPTPSTPFPENPPLPGETDGMGVEIGHWHHIGFTGQYHPTPLQASGFVSKPIGSATLGIEHTFAPAPGVGLIMLAGSGLAMLGKRRAGRCRLA